jgi:hypothetical protein
MYPLNLPHYPHPSTIKFRHPSFHHSIQNSDAMASLVAVCGIAGSALGYSLLDPLAGLVVCFMLLCSGVDIASSGLRPLVKVHPKTLGPVFALSFYFLRHSFSRCRLFRLQHVRIYT